MVSASSHASSARWSSRSLGRPRDVEPARLAVHDHEVGGLLVERGERGADVADRAHGMTGGADPRLDLRLGQADDEHAGLAAPH